MPRYEFQEGNSSKFWEITLDGTSFTTTYGRIGTSGQSTSKDWNTAAIAKKEYEKVVAEKVKKGYELVSDGKSPAKPPAKAVKSAVFDDEGDEEEDDTPKAKAKAKPAAPAPKPAGASKRKGNDARRFEFVEGMSSKFWEISLEGTSFTTRYGKIGTDGQATVKEFDDDARARKEYDKLVSEKVKKGYVEL